MAQTNAHLQGWPIVGWWGALLLAGLLSAIGVLGWNGETASLLARLTARVAALLFALAFAAAALRRLWRISFTGWLLRNRRYVGVSFAVSHFVHLGTLGVLRAQFPARLETEVATVVAGAVVYPLIAAMAATSFDRAVRWLGRTRWRALHLVGGWSTWSIFMATYLGRALENPTYIPLVVWMAAVPVLRIAAWRYNRR